MLGLLVLGLLVVGLLACGAPPPPEAGPPPPAMNQVGAPTSAPAPPPDPTIATIEPEPAPAASAERFPGAAFPPPAFEPLHERTAKPGDGTFEPLDGLPAGIAYRAVLHPHPIKKWIRVTVVAFDRRAIDLTLVAGTQEPSSTVAEALRPGLVPAAAHEDLLVVFNGGFKAQHGRYGMMLGGEIFLPPKDDACGVALYDDARLRIAPWPQLADDAPSAAAWRQTPPCLVVDGVKNERLKSEFRSRKWGAAKGGKRDIRRSAIALDASGRTLMYGFGEWVSAGELADAMLRAGADDVAELDINWSYTRFYWFEHPPGEVPKIAGSIIPKAEYSARRYIEKPSYRDFFYVTRRRASP